MKTILNLTFALVFSICSYTTQAQTKSITFYQSIPSTDANLAIFECDGSVEVKVWDKDYIMVHSKVTCSGIQPSSIRALAKKGRYEFASEMNFNNFLTISQPKVANAFRVNNTTRTEQITYTIFVPVNLDVEIESPNDLVEDYDPVPVIEIKESANTMDSFYR